MDYLLDCALQKRCHTPLQTSLPVDGSRVCEVGVAEEHLRLGTAAGEAAHAAQSGQGDCLEQLSAAQGT